MNSELLAFENETVLPLLTEIKAEPVRVGIPELSIGDLAFVMTGVPYRVEDGVRWKALSVQYRDIEESDDEVFAFDAELVNGAARLQRAELAGVFRLTRENGLAVWRNPLDNGRRLFTFRQDDADRILLNAWYLFRAVVLPMLYMQHYRFCYETVDAVRFQELVMGQLHLAFRGLE